MHSSDELYGILISHLMGLPLSFLENVADRQIEIHIVTAREA
jgi:hypothetical protein